MPNCTRLCKGGRPYTRHRASSHCDLDPLPAFFRPVNSAAYADEDTETETDDAGPSHAPTRSPKGKGKVAKKARTQAPLRAPASSTQAPAVSAQDAAMVPISHEARQPSGADYASMRHQLSPAAYMRLSVHQHNLNVLAQLQHISLSSMHEALMTTRHAMRTAAIPARMMLPKSAAPSKALTWLHGARALLLAQPSRTSPPVQVA